jgi:cytochrome c553
MVKTRKHLSRRDNWTLLASVVPVLAFGIFLLAGYPSPSAQTLHYAQKPSVEKGKEIWTGGCIACHGGSGKGAPAAYTVFKRPDTWPDFTDCAGTTPEPNEQWKATIVHGGPTRGLSQIMPAFGDQLTDQQIDDVIAYMRSLCNNTHHFPRGELNLPRAIVTEKAFPEDETVASTVANATGAPSWTTDIIDERTIIDARTQLETDVPINYVDVNHNWTEGVGDITIGVKRELFSSLRTGSIFAVQGGILLPTGDSNRGFGAGTTQFEPFASFDQLFRYNLFAQFQLGADLPVNTSIAPRNLFYRTAIGNTFAPDHFLGRQFSPMVEFVASRDFSPGASTDWDILPQMQVTVSRRQHVRAAIGYRDPFTNTLGRSSQVTFYVLWDRADGRIWDGWR